MTVLGTHTVTIVRPAGSDPYGDPLPGGSEVQEQGWFVQPGASTEQTGQRDTVTTEQIGFAPPDSIIKATDRIRWNGALYQVDGDPARWDDIHARPHHVEVRLRRVEG